LTVGSTEVLVTRNAGSPQAATGTSALLIGDQVATDVNGTAIVTFPSGCQINLQNQSLVTITQIDDCACAAPVQADGAFGALATNGIGLPETAMLITTTVIAGGAIIEGTSGGGGGNNCPPGPVSPPCTTVP
jgi:hypothetical protein